jgi:NAD+ kinase
MEEQRHLIGFMQSRTIPGAPAVIRSLIETLDLHDRSWVAPVDEEGIAPETLRATALIVTAGGDGTIIRVNRLAAPYSIPIVGINMGRVGFMSEIDSRDALEEIEWYLEGNGRIDERAMLKATLSGENGEILHALNDVTVHRGAELRIIEVKAVIDDVELSTYRGDGLIVATSTGSTGYTLQLGGPVIDPNASVFLLKPIAAHMSQIGGVVLDSNSVLELTLDSTTNATLTIDGYISRKMHEGDAVLISRSERCARFLRGSPKSGFWEGLSHRLGMRIGAVRRGEESGS